jgi:phosphoribosylformimino-5-aminoimidazole carboxamide ribotide isomerase
VAGGVRDHNTIHRWIETGADRVVIGTLAVEQPEIIEKAMEKHQDKIAVAVDARSGKAATKGWIETSDRPVDGFMSDMARRGVRNFIYTDISRDGMLQHLDFSGLRHILDVVAAAGQGIGLIYSGGVTSVEDVVALSTYEVEGCIVGTALYDGRLDLEVAIQALATGDGT